MIPVYQAVNRTRMLMSSSWLQDIPDPADRVDQSRGMPEVDLAAEEADVGFDHVAADCGAGSPDALLDDRPAEGLPGVPHQELQHLILAGGELHGPLSTSHGTSRGIQGQVRHAEHRGPRRTIPAKERADPGQQLLEGDGL